jgi:hypothetical protein
MSDCACTGLVGTTQTLYISTNLTFVSQGQNPQATVAISALRPGYFAATVTIAPQTCCLGTIANNNCTLPGSNAPVPATTVPVAIQSNGDAAFNSFGADGCTVTSVTGNDNTMFAYRPRTGQDLAFDFMWNLPAQCGGPIAVHAVTVLQLGNTTTGSCYPSGSNCYGDFDCCSGGCSNGQCR